MVGCQTLWVLVSKAQTITFSKSIVLSAINQYVNTASSIVAVFQHRTVFMNWVFKELTRFCLYCMYTACDVLVCQEQAYCSILHTWKQSELGYALGDECVFWMKLEQK